MGLEEEKAGYSRTFAVVGVASGSTWRIRGTCVVGKENANYYVLFRVEVCGGLVSGFLTPIARIVTSFILMINLLTKSP